MKYKKIIVCVNKEKYLDYATTIVTYLSSLGIKTSLRIGWIEGCIIEEIEKHKNTLLICLSSNYLFYCKGKGCTSNNCMVNDEILEILKTKKLSDVKMPLGSIVGNIITLSMKKIELSETHPFKIVIHELLHLCNEEHCQIGDCIGAEFVSKESKMCPECKKDFKKVIKYFKRGIL